MTTNYSPLFSAASKYLLSTTEASKLLHVSPETLRRLTAQGRLAAKRTSGGHRRWERERLLAYAYEQNHRTEDDVLEIIVLNTAGATTNDDASQLGATSEDTLSTSEASKLLHVSPATLRRLTDQGRLPFKYTSGGHRRWERKAVLAYAQEQRHQGADVEIEVVNTIRAVWQGKVTVKRNGNRTWHEIECRKVPSGWVPKPLKTVERGGVWILEEAMELTWRWADGGCIARRYLHCYGATRQAVEAEIKAHLPAFIEEIQSLPTPSFDNPGDIPRTGHWPNSVVGGRPNWTEETAEITTRAIFPVAPHHDLQLIGA